MEEKMIEFRKVKPFHAFTIPSRIGSVFVKANRTGFREGRGGPMHTCPPETLVLPLGEIA